MRKVNSYKCPHCGMKFKTLGGWNSHVEQLHSKEIPEGFTTSQYFYLILTGVGLSGPLCPICKEKTPWNENTLKYARMCGKESCRKKAAEIAKQNMVKKHGKEHLLNDPDVQKKMLRGRRISGQYEFDDGIKFDYTGSYEKDFLIMLNDFLNWPSADLVSPSPNVYKYIYQNKEHFYIPDFYIPSLNLEIEIKDGGDNPNNHWKIQAVDKVKEMEKDKALNSKLDINYVKVLNKDNSSFFEYLINLKEENMGVTESFIANCCPIVPYQSVIRDFDMEYDIDIETWIEKSISRFNENKYDELISNESYMDSNDITS